MMKDYFFVPGNRLHKLATIEALGVYIIIDLEDAVKASDRVAIIDELCKNPLKYKKHYLRIPLYDVKLQLNIQTLQKLIDAGYSNFIFPKLQSTSDFEFIIKVIYKIDLKLILLVETARFFLELEQILLTNRGLIKGLALGSHDFMSEIGGNHTLKNLEYPRLKLLYLARMINIEAIDIASMELKDENLLRNEITDGFHKGYDAKFYIHPWQLECKRKMKLYSEADLVWAKKVIIALGKVEDKEEFNPIIIDNQIIERPHLNKAKKIINHYETK
jgi:citrate lyase beta subunit